MDPQNAPNKNPSGSRPFPVIGAVGAIVVLALIGGLGSYFLAGRPRPIPVEIASDPQLLLGHGIYVERCLACHGASGAADGPLSRSATGPLPRNLVKEPWKFGEKPDQVLAVLNDGTKDSLMPGWSGTLRPEEVKAVAAYLYQITGKPIPDEVRSK